MTEKDPEIENAIQVARKFTVTAPTFSYDGIEESLRLTLVGINKSIPPQYIIEVKFYCGNSGYGDRTKKFVLAVITGHVLIVTVVEDKVKSAIMDEKWDEINQEHI